MDYENFKESFIEDLKADLYEKGLDVSVKVSQVDKMNESYEAITVTPEGSNIGVNLNMEKFFEAYENGTDFDAVIAKAADVIEGGLNNQPTVDVASLTDYDQMKDKLIMEVVSADANADMLAKVPHQNIEDMAVVYRFVIDSNDDGRATILVTNQLIETMGVTPEQLHADALENAPELTPAVIKGMSEVMAEMMGMSPEELAMMGMPTDPADEQMYVATVPDKIHGAGVIAYQDFMDQASERIGGGEICGLRWKDVDLNSRVIDINHSMTYFRRGKKEPYTFEFKFGPPKTKAGIRKIPMLDDVYDVLKELYDDQCKHGFSDLVVDGATGFIFINKVGQLYKSNAIDHSIHRIVNNHNAQELVEAKKEGREPILLPLFSCHTFRHTFCTRFCENETNVKVIQAVMGHADIKTTMDIYAEVTEGKKRESIEHLSKNMKIFRKES